MNPRMPPGWRLAFASLGFVACTAGIAAPQTNGPTPSGVLKEAAQTLGMRTCGSVAERLSPLAGAGTSAQELLIDWDRAEKRDGPVFAVVGMQFQNATAAMLLSAVPESDGSCTFAAERIALAPYPCQSVAEAELKNHRAVRLLTGLTVYVDNAEPAATVLLFDSPPGCMVLRRHVQFHWLPNPKKTP